MSVSEQSVHDLHRRMSSMRVDGMLEARKGTAGHGRRLGWGPVW